MADFEDLAELKRKVEHLQKEQNKAEGALEQALDVLSKKFGCKDIKAAENKLKALVADEAKAKDAFDKAMKLFYKEWNHVIGSE